MNKHYVYLQYPVIQGLIRLNQIIRISMTRYGWTRVMLFSWTLSTLMALITTQFQVRFKMFNFDTKIQLLQKMFPFKYTYLIDNKTQVIQIFTDAPPFKSVTIFITIQIYHKPSTSAILVYFILAGI